MTLAPRLLTIPISHYCEKVRWALERAGIGYTEEAHLQGFHYLAVRRAGGVRTVPVLVHRDGVLTDSTDILHWVDARTAPARRLFPDDPTERVEVARLEAHFDAALGPDGRLWMYHHLLAEAPELAGRYGLTGVPGWQRAVFRPALPLMKRLLRHRLHITAARAQGSLDACRRVMEGVAARLADGRRYLVGGRFSAADLTFAALSAPLVLPPAYGVPLPQPCDLPPTFARHVQDFRQHPAGCFALDLYARHRRA